MRDLGTEGAGYADAELKEAVKNKEQIAIVVLGGGPAGCGAAFELRRRDKARVTLVEQQPVVGGNAGSFLHNGFLLRGPRHPRRAHLQRRHRGGP